MNQFIGKWKITEMEAWDSAFINEQGTGYFELNADGQGSFMFGYVEGDIHFREPKTNEKPKIEYSWLGTDEMDDVSGCGWFEPVSADELYGVIYFHQGDDSWVRVKRFK